MATLTNLLTVLNLLHNRQAVSIELIQEECGVSRSTAYRYITIISEANFSVMNDREIGGFRLAHKWGKGICNFTEEEAAFIVAACEQYGHVGHNGNKKLSMSVRHKLEMFLPTVADLRLQFAP
jgi:predicted DNA-binding transcriptional regulator YafY